MIVSRDAAMCGHCNYVNCDWLSAQCVVYSRKGGRAGPRRPRPHCLPKTEASNVRACSHHHHDDVFCDSEYLVPKRVGRGWWVAKHWDDDGGGASWYVIKGSF